MPRSLDEPPQARRWAPWLMLATLTLAIWLLMTGYARDGLGWALLIPAGFAAYSIASIWIGRYLLGAQDQRQITREALAVTSTAYRTGIEVEAHDKAVDDAAQHASAPLGRRARRPRSWRLR